MTDAVKITEDICRCQHVASQHLDGSGECTECAETATKRGATWAIMAACKRFDWAYTWEEKD